MLKVSIITPSYNQSHFLEECINSVLNQDYPIIEYVILDGGSTDGSVDVIKKYSRRLAYWISKPDEGQSAAINEGLRHVTGEVWGWVNSDDVYLPGAIANAVNCLESHPEFDIVSGDCLWVDENGQKERYFHAHGFNLHDMLSEGIRIPSGSTFIRRTASDQIGNFDETLHYYMDNEFWLRAAQKCVFGHIPKALSLYRVYPSAKTWDVSQSERRASEIVGVKERFWNNTNLPKIIRSLKNKSLSSTYLYAAELALEAGNRKLCVQYLRKDLSLGFAGLKPWLLRVLIRLWFGNEVAIVLQNLWHSTSLANSPF